MTRELSDSPETAYDLSQSECDELVEGFERAWRVGARPEIETYVKSDKGANRHALLVDLVHVDLEHRLAAGEAARIEEYLSRFPALGLDRHAIVGLVRSEYEMRRRHEPELGIADYVRRFPWCRDMLPADLALRSPAVSRLPNSNSDSARSEFEHDTQVSPMQLAQGCSSDPYATITYRPTTSTSAGSRYRVLRPHATGGLGEVFVAQDEELGREVALKQIRAEFADQVDSRARFILEAEITGGLEHPGVVPVYSLGADENGRPYYAMRFIRGDSLKDAIEQFHRADQGGKRDPGERALALRKLLARFIDVCNAIEYSHARGVLHRDLKPSNIMLGKYGETLVVDWGIAKVIGRKELTPNPAPMVDEVSLRPTGGGDSVPTRLGAVVGTPQYMSPEQAAGRNDELGAASDVYSLGATLYCLLTGDSPLSDRTCHDVWEVLGCVKRGDVTPPRQIKPAIPKSLDAICRKAMALSPKARYSSARALADDLEHWLADEPTTALSEGPVDRLFRLARRHRAVALTTTAAATMIAIVASVATVLVNQQLQVAERLAQENKSLALSEKEARQKAEESAIVAEREHQAARQLADEKTRLAEDNAKATKDAESAANREKAAREVAEDLVVEKTRLAKEKSDLAESEARSRENAAKLSEFLIGAIQPADPTRFSGATFFAPKADWRTFTVWEMIKVDISRAYQELDRSPVAQAAVLNSLGNVCRQLAVFKPAERMLTDALKIRRDKLDPLHPDLATSCFHTAWYYQERGDFVKARPLYAEALKIRRKLPNGESAVAETLQNLAWLCYYDDSPTEMDNCFEEAVRIRDKILKSSEADPGKTLLRDAVYTKLGYAAASAGQSRMLDAKRIANDPALREQLITLQGNNKLADALRHFISAGDDRVFRDPAKACDELQQALMLIQQDKTAGEVLELPVNFELAHSLARLNRLAEAERCYQIVIEITRHNKMFQIPKQSDKIREVADFYVKRGKIVEAKELWQEYLESQKFRFEEQHRFYKEAETAQRDFLRAQKQNRPSSARN